MIADSLATTEQQLKDAQNEVFGMELAAEWGSDGDWGGGAS